MVNKNFLILFLVIFLGLISLNFVSAAATNVTECRQLNASTTLYQLNQSINMTGWHCLGINNHSIILDCAGYNITLNGADGSNWSAVNALNFNNITVKNCVFLQNFTGSATMGEGQDVISFINSTNSTIFNNTFEVSGIFFSDSINANITANTINNSVGAAISLDFSSNSSVIENNNITTISMGISVMGSPNTNISSNNITSSSIGVIDQSMIRLEDSDGSIVDHNIIIISGEGASGVAMDDSHDVIVYLNTITTTGNYSSGIFVYNSSFNTIANNTLNTTNGYAIYVDGLLVEFYNHTVENNTEQGGNILYLFNNDSGIIEDQSLGQLIVTNSTNITIDNVTVDYDGLTFVFTNDSIINNSNFTGFGNNVFGIDFSQASHNNVTGCWVKTLIGNESCVIFSVSSDYNLFYNNIFNTSTNDSGACLPDVVLSTNNWNTTKKAGTNIINGPNLGGNFWTNSLGTGYSDTCTDDDGDYICEDPLSLAIGDMDYLPLADHTNMISGCSTLDVENKTYYLNQTIVKVNGTCFNITANGITLNFEGFNITGNTTGYGINVTGYNDTTIEGGFAKGVISNFSNGIYISSSSNNDFRYLRINNSVQDAILLEGNTSDNNNFTGINVLNTNASHYDINFSAAGIDGTWIEDMAGFANYTFTGAGGKVNFKEPNFGEIKFIEAINGSGSYLSKDVDIETNLVFVNGSQSGLNKSANISLYHINYTNPKPQYSSDNVTWTDCTTGTDPVCVELTSHTVGETFTFSVSHFTYFRAAEGYTAPTTNGGRTSDSSEAPVEVKEIHSWTQITPGVPVIMKDFDSEIGIKQIQIEVHTEAQDVKITVTKHSAKPAEVAVEKSGKVHQYLQIETENLEDKLEKGIVTIQIEKFWVSNNSLEEDDIALFKYNESEERWDELTTTSTGEDATYYYYDVELDEFSYFAISEKAVVSDEESSAEEGISVWVWILVAVVIIVIIVWQMKTKKK